MKNIGLLSFKTHFAGMSPEHQGLKGFLRKTQRLSTNTPNPDSSKIEAVQVCLNKLRTLLRVQTHLLGWLHLHAFWVRASVCLAASEQSQTQQKSNKYNYCDPDHSRWMQGLIIIIYYSTNLCISDKFYQQWFCAYFQIIAQNIEEHLS